MNKFLVLLQELNLFDKKVLKTQLDQLLVNKGVSDNRIINWFNTKYVRWFISPEDDEHKMKFATKHKATDDSPQWVSNTFDFTRFDNEEIDKINHMIDFFSNADALQAADITLDKLDRLTYTNVVSLVQKWDESMRNRKRGKASGDVDAEVSKSVKGAATKLKNGVDFKVLSKVDSYFWVKHLTKESLQCEGDDMGHCVGGYDPRRSNIVSLWDSKGNSHVTLELSNSTGNNPLSGVEANQIKGKGNSRPDDKYIPYIKDLVIKNNIKVLGDGEALDMLQFEDEYYFEDSPQWENIYKTKIIPKQQAAFDEIKRRIVSS